MSRHKNFYIFNVYYRFLIRGTWLHRYFLLIPNGKYTYLKDLSFFVKNVTHKSSTSELNKLEFKTCQNVFLRRQKAF